MNVYIEVQLIGGPSDGRYVAVPNDATIITHDSMVCHDGARIEHFYARVDIDKMMYCGWGEEVDGGYQRKS